MVMGKEEKKMQTQTEESERKSSRSGLSIPVALERLERSLHGAAHQATVAGETEEPNGGCSGSSTGE